MATSLRIQLPKFLGDRHLVGWLTGSEDGLRIFAEARRKWMESTEGQEFLRRVRSPEEWLRTTDEGRRMVAEATKEQVNRPRVLCLLYGNGEVEVIAEGNARIKFVHLKGNPSIAEAEKTVGIGWSDLTYWPNPEPPIVRSGDRVLTDLEIACVRQAADAWEAVDRVLGAMTNEAQPAQARQAPAARQQKDASQASRGGVGAK